MSISELSYVSEADPSAERPEAIDGLIGEALRRGRGARSNRTGRFETQSAEAFDDGWDLSADVAPTRTTVRDEIAKSIISRNDSPDLSFEQSINPYRGCEHGCIYCYARPTHTYLGHSAGIDFESIIYAKSNAAALLRKELARPGYVPKTIALGAVTDPYQPVERGLRITRSILEVLEEAAHPVGIVTKSAGILRDLDVLARLAQQRLVKVAISVTTLDRALSRSMEPRAATPEKRLDAIRQLTQAGIPVTVMVAPIVPALNDSEIESILEAAAKAGATEAGFVLLRLPLELKDLFREWLQTDHPDRAKRVISLLRSMHGGRDYVATFGHRQRGSGPFAEQIAARFRLSLRRLSLNQRTLRLRTDLFRPPGGRGSQLQLL